MRKVRIGTVAFLVDDTPHSIEMNVERGCRYVAEAAARGCDVVLLPELFRTINVPEGEILSEEMPGPTSYALAEAARQGKINVIANWYVEEDGRIYNQTSIFDRSGESVGSYRKVQPTAGEARMVTPGNELPVFELDFGRIAIMVCLDIYFPEIPRIYAHKGAEIIFWPTVTLGPTQEGLKAQLISRAIDNSMPIVEANMAVHPPYSPFTGRFRPGTARIVDFNGEIIASTGRHPGIAVAEIDLDEIRLTSYAILKREPDHFREDLEAITRLDLFAEEYRKLAASQRRDEEYFGKIRGENNQESATG